MVFIKDNHKSISVFEYVQQNASYTESEDYQYSWNNNPNFTDYKIVGVLPADFNNDRTTDVMVVFSHNKKPLNYRASIVWNMNGGFKSSHDINATFSDHPFLLDVNGDLFTDFICIEGNQRYYYINQITNPGIFKKVEDSFGKDLDTSRGSQYVYADLNGDCAADLFIISQKTDGKYNFEFYYAENTELKLGFFQPPDKEVSAEHFGSPLAVDMDGNGKLDLVIPTCSKTTHGRCSESKIFTYYNDPCHPQSAETCKKYKSPCTKYDFVLDARARDTFDKFEHNNDLWGFVEYDPKDMFSSPVMLRPGDFDSDGHVDLVTILKYDTQDQVVIFQNVDNAKSPGGRTLVPKWRDDVALSESHTSNFKPYAVAPVDAAGIGNPQLFVLGRNGDDFCFDLLLSKQTLDSFWFKVTVLCEKCEDSSTTMIGAVAFYSTTGYKGTDEVGYGVQSSHVAVNSLQAPYMLFGLGQQANYIEWVKIAYRKHDPELEVTGKEKDQVQSYQFQNIIPNAQVFAIPKGPDNWRLVMLVVPGKLLWETLIVIGSSCLLCCIIILALHIKEKKEDEREKIKFSNKFHFGAM